MPAPPTKVVFARVPAPIYDAVVALSESQRVPLSAIVALALRDFTDRIKPSDRIELGVSHVEG